MYVCTCIHVYAHLILHIMYLDLYFCEKLRLRVLRWSILSVGIKLMHLFHTNLILSYLDCYRLKASYLCLNIHCIITYLNAGVGGCCASEAPDFQDFKTSVAARFRASWGSRNVARTSFLRGIMQKNDPFWQPSSIIMGFWS